MCDEGCICKGNWREIVKEIEPFFGRRYKDENKREYTLFGVVHADDDYYYGLVDTRGRLMLASCVGSLETSGFTLIEGKKQAFTPEQELLKEIFGETEEENDD
jgi:hypothetical protein